jgi:hypothetical protein
LSQSLSDTQYLGDFRQNWDRYFALGPCANGKADQAVDAGKLGFLESGFSQLRQPRRGNRARRIVNSV